MTRRIRWKRVIFYSAVIVACLVAMTVLAQYQR